MENTQKKKLGNKTWTVIWVVVGLLCMAIYPGKSTFIAGWIPVSAVKTFGLMVLIVILNWFFSEEKLS